MDTMQSSMRYDAMIDAIRYHTILVVLASSESLGDLMRHMRRSESSMESLVPKKSCSESLSKMFQHQQIMAPTSTGHDSNINGTSTDHDSNVNRTSTDHDSNINRLSNDSNINRISTDHDSNVNRTSTDI
jgi:hypothetical protein